MSDQEINQSIAELRGWKFEQFRCVSPDGKVFRGYPLANQLCHAPDYCRDLNAMHEAEKVLCEYTGEHGEEYSQRDNYAKELMKLCGTWNGSGWDWGSVCDADLYKAAHATARQRAEAFLKTLGKWKE